MNETQVVFSMAVVAYVALRREGASKNTAAAFVSHRYDVGTTVLELAELEFQQAIFN